MIPHESNATINHRLFYIIGVKKATLAVAS